MAFLRFCSMCQNFLKQQIKTAKRLTKLTKNNIMMLRGYPLNAPDHAQKRVMVMFASPFWGAYKPSKWTVRIGQKTNINGCRPAGPKESKGRLIRKKTLCRKLSAALRKELLMPDELSVLVVSKKLSGSIVRKIKFDKNGINDKSIKHN